MERPSTIEFRGHDWATGKTEQPPAARPVVGETKSWGPKTDRLGPDHPSQLNAYLAPGPPPILGAGFHRINVQMNNTAFDQIGSMLN